MIICEQLLETRKKELEEIKRFINNPPNCFCLEINEMTPVNIKISSNTQLIINTAKEYEKNIEHEILEIESSLKINNELSS